MDKTEAKLALGKPEIEKLKSLGSDLKVGKVFGDRVLVKTVTPWTKADELEKQGLIYVPDSAKEQNTPKPSTGIVVEVGPFIKWLKPGDMVMFGKYSGTDFNIGGEEGFRILDLKEILCTLEAKDPIVPIID